MDAIRLGDWDCETAMGTIRQGNEVMTTLLDLIEAVDRQRAEWSNPCGAVHKLTGAVCSKEQGHADEHAE